MPRRYSLLMIALHWTIAILMFMTWWIGERLEDLPRGPDKLFVMVWHIYWGLLIAVLLVPRLLIRLKGVPAFPADMPGWERLAAKAGHLALYLVMAALIVTGLIAITSGPQLPLVPGWTTPRLFARPWHEAMEEAHGLANNAFLVIVAIHILAALYHLVIRRDGLFGRMLPWTRRV